MQPAGMQPGEYEDGRKSLSAKGGKKSDNTHLDTPYKVEGPVVQWSVSPGTDAGVVLVSSIPPLCFLFSAFPKREYLR